MNVHFHEPISLLVAPIAAKQGDASKIKITNDKALAVVNKLVNDIVKNSSPRMIPNVATIVSFAKKPLIIATVDSQFPHPRGIKIGAINSPIDLKILCSVSTLTRDQSKLCKNQMTIQATKIIVPALIINDLIFS